MRTKLKLIAALALLIAGSMVSARPARADSWVAPGVRTYYSANRVARLIVTLHLPTENQSYVSRPRGPSAPDRAGAVLQRRDARRRWVVQWQGRLVNQVAPVDALVADSGRYFVTFDDWGDRGNGPNVVVIYSGDGRVIRALSLTDLVPRDYVEALVRTSFSVWWTGGGHRISGDGERLLISMGIPSAGQILDPTDHFALAVTLATGAPDRGGPEWDRAMAAARTAAAAERRRQADQVAYMTDPLRAPRTSDREAWDAYLHEAFKRLAPDWETNNSWNMLVRPPGLPSYEGAWSPDPRTIFREPPMAIAIGSPEGVPLAAALAPIVAQRRPGWLRGVRLYIAADDVAWPISFVCSRRARRR